jgi:hypothetical protein
MNARSAKIAAGFVKTIPIDHGKANMPAPAALPARLARSVRRPQEAKRRDCRMTVEPIRQEGLAPPSFPSQLL